MFARTGVTVKVKNLSKYFNEKILRGDMIILAVVKLKQFINLVIFMRHLLNEL